MISPIRLGDYVRFRAGMAHDALKGRERDLGTVVALVPHDGADVWPVVQFDGYRTPAVAPGLLEIVGEDWPAADFAAEDKQA